MPAQQALLPIVSMPRPAIASLPPGVSATLRHQPDCLKYAARLSDLVMLCTLFVSAATAVGISMMFYETTLAVRLRHAAVEAAELLAIVGR